MTSRIIVNNIQSDTGVSTVTIASPVALSGGITGTGFAVGTGASISSPATNTLTVSTSNVERLRIDSNGNIGIATTNPLVRIHAVGSGDIIAIESTSNTDRSAIRYFTNGNDWELGARASSNSAYPNSFYLYDNASSAYRMIVDSGGRVFKPSQVNFMARNHTNGTGGVGSRTIIYGTVEHNIGSGYNSSNGIFTAPVAGYYMFGYGIFTSGTANRRLSTMNINGTGKVEVTTEANNDTYTNLAFSGIFYLNASDTASVSSTADILTGGIYGNFYGYLLG